VRQQLAFSDHDKARASGDRNADRCADPDVNSRLQGHGCCCVSRRRGRNQLGYDALNKAYPGTTFTSIAQAKRYWSRAVTLERTFLTAIFAITYPSFMKADVDAQIAAETKLVEDDTELAANPTDSAAQATATTDGSAEAGTANVVRHDLSLPQVPLT
jgi:hypothetical protein